MLRSMEDSKELERTRKKRSRGREVTTYECRDDKTHTNTKKLHTEVIVGIKQIKHISKYKSDNCIEEEKA